jgi:hypothetical protein
MELYKDTHMQKIALLSDATTIDSALNYVKSKRQQQQQQQQKKHLALDSTDDDHGDGDIDSGDSNSELTKEGGRQTIF